jgi:hypothetical protein
MADGGGNLLSEKEKEKPGGKRREREEREVY